MKSLVLPAVIITTIGILAYFFLSNNNQTEFEEIKEDLALVTELQKNLMQQTEMKRLLQDTGEEDLRVNNQRYDLNNWEAPTLPAHLQGADQQNTELIAEIRRSWILPPEVGALNLTHPTKKYFSQQNQDEWLDEYFMQKTDGFFIECGAYDGEDISNSLFFERERNWQGLLIEANPTNFKSVLSKHRNAYKLNACLSGGTTAQTLKYVNVVSHPYLSRLDVDYTKHKNAIMNMTGGDMVIEEKIMQCFPLYSILAALDHPHVDFFSLDIEGTEHELLKASPLDKINVDVYLIEMGSHHDEPRKNKVHLFEETMKEYGYKAYDLNTTFDAVFTRLQDIP